MATYFWNSFSGKWGDAANWLGGVAPGKGDTAVVAHGTITNSTPDMSGLTIEGQTIEVIAANQLTLSGTTLAASTSLLNQDADGLVISASGFNQFAGPVTLKGATDLYLIPGTTSMILNTGTITAAAPVAVLGAGPLVNLGTITVAPPDTASQASFAVKGFGVQTQNDGLIDIAGPAGAPVGNTSATFGALTGTGTIRAANAEVTFGGTVAPGGTFEFADAKAVLQLALGASGFGATIKGFQPGNRIDLGLGAAESVSYIPDPGGTSGTLQVYSGGSPVGTLAFSGSYTIGSFVLAPDGGGDFSLSVPCFAQGTRLRTLRGEVAVEALAVGDVLPTRLGGESARVVWLGRRKVACARHPRPQDVMPVRVREGAFAPGVPARDVVLSPDHAVHVDGVLVPVRYLLNDATIVQETVDEITYWHVELERHDVIEAAGLAVESYLDTGNRDSFANGAGGLRLHPDFAADTSGAAWRSRACATLCLEGPAVQAVQQRLLARARALGWRMLRRPGLRLFADGRRVRPEVAGTQWRVALPPGTRSLRWVSGAGVPERLRPGSGDGRRLGIALAAPVWNGRAATLEHPRYRRGWHGAEAGWRWTDGDAELDVRGLSEVAFTLLASEPHWRAPPAAGPERRREAAC